MKKNTKKILVLVLVPFLFACSGKSNQATQDTTFDNSQKDNLSTARNLLGLWKVDSGEIKSFIFGKNKVATIVIDNQPLEYTYSIKKDVISFKSSESSIEQKYNYKEVDKNTYIFKIIAEYKDGAKVNLGVSKELKLIRELY